MNGGKKATSNVERTIKQALVSIERKPLAARDILAPCVYS
jgi:hypothetical protein